MSFLSLTGICKSAGKKAILKDVSLNVGQGEILGIIGPSGAGKTTLLRIIDMLDRQDNGQIIYDGKDLWSGSRLDTQRSMAMVFQKPVAFSRSVYDNVAFGLRLRHVDPVVIDSRVREALKLLDMDGRERQYAKSLSGGEVQRVAFARTYVLRPKLLLLDEPTANLDPANISILERAIIDINAKYGTTVLLVTHNMHQAKRLATRTAFMMDGEIVEESLSKQLFESPRDPRTGMFVRGELVY